MRKFAIGTAILSLIAGIVGFVLRNLYLTRAIEPDTGLPLSGAPSLLMMVLYSVFIVILAFALSFAASRSFGSVDNYREVVVPSGLLFRVCMGTVCVLILASGVLGLVPLLSAAEIDYTAIIHSGLLVLTGICLIGLMHEVSTKRELKGAYVFSLVPEIAITFWLLIYYRSHQVNPTLFSYAFFAIALAASAFGFYFTASYVYGRPAPLRFIFSHTTAIYFLIMSLADDLPLPERLCFIGLALFFIVNLAWFINNLSTKKKSRQKTASVKDATASVPKPATVKPAKQEKPKAQKAPEIPEIPEEQPVDGIVDFGAAHVEQARLIAKKNYKEERVHVPTLPSIDEMPDLAMFADNGLGVAAFEDGEMVGFLCCFAPFENAFRTTNANGVFSPMGANGAIEENRADIYTKMYQAAGKKWAAAGAASHAICLYAHDKEVQEQFFRYGFGIRCIDAVRAMADIHVFPRKGFSYRELLPKEFQLVFPLNKQLVEHMKNGPTFMSYPHIDDEELIKMILQPGVRYFATFVEEQMISYIKIAADGENFACDAPDMMNICGAYCLPEHRGTGLFQSLLNFTIQKLKAEGYKRLGVDFESFNPNAYGFWLKYFDAYTHSVVRRIDEHAIGRR